MMAVFGGIRTGGGLLVAGLAWLLAGRRLLCAPVRLLALVVVGEMAATALAFLVSDAAPDVEVRTSATRLVGQWLPLALCAAVIALDGAEAEREAGDAGVGFYNRRGR
jgi:hypothetical protein